MFQAIFRAKLNPAPTSPPALLLPLLTPPLLPSFSCPTTTASASGPLAPPPEGTTLTNGTPEGTTPANDDILISALKKLIPNQYKEEQARSYITFANRMLKTLVKVHIYISIQVFGVLSLLCITRFS
jgi:hypothetical protein